MAWLTWAILVSGAYPFWRTWQAVRGVSLAHAVVWGAAAWASWLAAGLTLSLEIEFAPALRYLALCLSSCAAVAVLGARRPHVAAWDFVVLALLAVLMLQLLEGLDRLRDSPVRLVFLGATLMIGLVNYGPTRFALAAVLAALGCSVVFLHLAVQPAHADFLERALPWAIGVLAISPWVALLMSTRSTTSVPAFDREWLTFRDRYGLVWGQRLREQFNRSAAHAGLPVYLSWRGARMTGLCPGSNADFQAAMLATLKALLKRFGLEEKTAL